MSATTILHHSNPDRTNSCGVKSAHSTTNPELVTCKRCLKAMAAREAQMGEWTETTMDGEPTTEPMKPAKPAKPATIHLHDIDRHPTYQTWCKIPGQHTTDPDAVTCKVCRAHIDGKAPLNAVPERVKQARKAFRSFVARVAYMVFMDEGCTLSGSWTVKHTNMAGDQYEVSSYGIYENGVDMAGPADLSNIKEWMEEHWSCGEDR